MNPFDQILKGNQTTPSSQSTGGYLASKLQERNVTQPVKKTTALDTAKDIVKSIVKLPGRAITNVAQIGQAVTKLPEVISKGSSTFTPVQPFGKNITPIGTRSADFGATPENFRKDLLDIGGAGLETLSYLPFVKGAATGFKTGKTVLGGLVKEGAIGGATGVAGQQLQQYAEDSTPMSLTDIAKGTAFGAVAGPALGVLGSQLGKMLGKGEQKVATEVLSKPEQQIPETLSSIINNGKKAPELAQQASEFIPTQQPTTFTPKISQEIEAEAVAKSFTEKFGDLPEIQRMDMRQQASDWQNLIDNDYDKAKRILLGQENAPDNLQVGIGLEAVTRKATKEGDWQILRELATNPNAAPTQASLAAQKLKAFDTNIIDSSDPIELMQSLSKAREKTVGIKNKAVKTEDVKILKETIKQSAPKKITDWNDFINSIEC